MSAIPAAPCVLVLLASSVALAATAPAPAPRFDRVERLAFNRAAVRLDLPLFWVADASGNGAVEPGEVAALELYGHQEVWVSEGRFTPAFLAAYEAIVVEAGRADVVTAGLDPKEVERRRLVRQDLDAGIATLVASDLSGLPADHRAFARRMLRAAELVDRLYARQCGAAALEARVPADDPASRRMFRRNWGPRGAAPATEQNEACTASPGVARRRVDAYPAALQDQGDFCARLEGLPDAARLLDPFTVVRERSSALVAVPYSEAWADEMGAVAAELEAAARDLQDPAEEALRTYLRAAAAGFRSNDWRGADEAWARMGARNSSWYLRVAPDEVYWDPCSQKAGFHLTLARIDRASLEWQDRLTPLRQEMEDRLAALVGPPYAARQVSFQLPDFVQIVANAGNDREPFGATLGQSLPNWGPVANEGRGRTVVMTNLYTDPDSLAIRRAQAAALLSPATLADYTDRGVPGQLATILHEAAHNLGPAHEYRVDGKNDGEVFGGGLASTLEELKAQTAALWYLELLRAKGVISDELARQSYVDSLVWAFGHISRGMYSDGGQRKPYSQLAAIQVGHLLRQGALRWDPQAPAANGSDRGAFTLDLAKVPAAVEELMRLVGGVKARGDRAAAEKLCAELVDGTVVPQALIAERMLRQPKASFVYSVVR